MYFSHSSNKKAFNRQNTTSTTTNNNLNSGGDLDFMTLLGRKKLQNELIMVTYAKIK